jgi:hypothetical protein
MRKLLLATTILVVSVTAHADPVYLIAADETPATQPAATAAETAKAPEPAKATEPANIAEPEKTAEPAPVAETKPVQVQKPKPRVARRESDEHKARRIAAKFGVYW